MTRHGKGSIAALLLVAGLAGCIVLLTGEGLDRAEKWISIAGVALSVIIGAAGIVLGWLTWRQTAEPRPPVNAPGDGAVGIGGESGGEVSTEVSSPTAAGPTGASGVTASGAGSVAIGGNSTAPIRTKVTGNEGK